MSAPLSEPLPEKPAQDADKDDETIDPVDPGADEPQDEEPFDLERYKASLSKKNRENESLRKRLKALEARDARLQQIEDAQKSEAERLTERATKAEGELPHLRLENNRLRLQIELGLTADQAARVSGDDYDDMKTDAEELLKLFNASASKGADQGKKQVPAKDLKGGLNPSADDDKFDAAALVDQIYKKSHIF